MKAWKGAAICEMTGEVCREQRSYVVYKSKQVKVAFIQHLSVSHSLSSPGKPDVKRSLLQSSPNLTWPCNKLSLYFFPKYRSQFVIRKKKKMRDWEYMSSQIILSSNLKFLNLTQKTSSEDSKATSWLQPQQHVHFSL